MKGDAPEADGGMNFEIDISRAFLTFETFTTKDDEEVKTPVIVVQEWADPDSDDDIPF